MDAILDALADAIRNADPEYGAPTLEPVGPGDHVIGTLSDEGRRIHAVRVLQVERLAAHMREHRRIVADPRLLSDAAVVNGWVIDNGSLTVKARLLESLMLLAIYTTMPEAALYDHVELRQGYRVVWLDDPKPKQLGDGMFADVLSHDPPGKPS